MGFSSDDFQYIFRRRDNQYYKDLVKRVGNEWKSLWKGYFDHLEQKKLGVWEKKRKVWEKISGSRGGSYVDEKPKPIRPKKSNPPRWDPSGASLTKFFEWVLKGDSEEDGYRTNRLTLIFLTSRLRDPLRGEDYLRWEVKAGGTISGVNYVRLREQYLLGLHWMIREWNEQAYSTCENDSLTTALIRLAYHPKHITWAINGHARRMRSGVGRPELRIGRDRSSTELKKIEISGRLLEAATRENRRKPPNDDQIDQFCFMPSEHFDVYLKGQKMLNFSRRGVQRKAARLGTEQLADLNKLEKPSNGDFWCTYLKWWTYFALIRAASASINVDKFVEYSKSMRELETNAAKPHKEYFESFHKEEEGRKWTGRAVYRSKEPLPAERKVPMDWPDELVLIQAFDNWRKFYGNEMRTIDQLSKSGMERIKSEFLEREWKDFCGSRGIPGHGFADIHRVAFGETRVGKFQPFRITRGGRGDVKKRVKATILEIAEARFAEMKKLGPLSCLILEILAREVIYRFWFEVAKMPTLEDARYKHELEEEIGDAIRVLEIIKDDIKDLRAFREGDDNHEFIDSSINELKKFDSEEAEKLQAVLRKHMEKWEKEPEHGKGRIFLGIPYAEHGDGFCRVQHSFVGTTSAVS